MPLNPQFADDLAAALRLRQMKRGLGMLASAEAEIRILGADVPNAPRILLLLAQWIDVGYRDHRLIEDVIARFPQNCRSKMSVEDYLCLSMVEAFRDFADGQLDSAIDRLDLVLRTFRNFPSHSDEALAHFWKGRAHTQEGRVRNFIATHRQGSSDGAGGP